MKNSHRKSAQKRRVGLVAPLKRNPPPPLSSRVVRSQNTQPRFAERNGDGDRLVEGVELEKYVAMAETQQSVAYFRDRGAPAEMVGRLDIKMASTSASSPK